MVYPVNVYLISFINAIPLSTTQSLFVANTFSNGEYNDCSFKTKIKWMNYGYCFDCFGIKI